jgi:AraC-like DNA-binding protein
MSRHSIRRQSGPRPYVAAADQGIVRVAALLGVAPLLREGGVDPAEVLTSLGLAPDTLNDADNRIHYRMGGQLLQHCAEITGCAHFGLLVGQQATIASLGMLGELMRRSPTVHSALRGLLLHLHLQTRGGVATHRVEGENATFGYAIYQRDMPGAAHAYDLVMAFEFNILRALCGAQWLPREVSFSHAKPGDLGPYRQFFRAPLRFNADRTEIVFSKTWLDHALPGHDAEAYRRLQRELATQLLLAPDDWAEQVRRALRTMIPSGRGSEAAISELLSIPTRTLRRLLGVQGTSFRALLEDVRYEIARQLLTDSDMCTAEIAEALDYADASAFTRAFRRWTASPPAAWRAMNRSATSRRELSYSNARSR